MTYKILPAEQGCNTARMVRVVDGIQLVAMFLSSADASAYIESKKKSKKK
ncbi:hypothetical protein [Pseudomonas abietaniphila]|nr:hypothetical protein [Pseudomonas abietaniphila]